MLKRALPLALLCAIAPQIAAAQEPAISDPSIKPRAPTLPVITDDTNLFETFGGREGLVAIMDDVMPRWVANPRTRPFFENADQTRIKALLVEQFCVVMKGPCTYSGRSMAEAHKGMNVNEGAFFALVEELQRTLSAKKVPFIAQNRLIAALAPMHRDIIDR
ncbi:group I truncated hemoglobin [Novosphingobium sp. JCM 18896]|uniref:group I truncated hemoglobin n=1 Tax=Novosphingobium sp. JCM 18896 TaxID=2989731 RepID=UPI00222182CE|nr:group 1 truncated hemoglobin [Novosphingobium sp. JCM 18896]MCW1427820.1 group 1 truncated hemoglobin [Novosphingobium sp. JCM 18896]